MVKYKVEWRKKPVTNATVIDKRDNIGDTQTAVCGLDKNAVYEFKVFAKNRAGYSEPAVKTFKVKKDSGKHHAAFNLLHFHA